MSSKRLEASLPVFGKLQESSSPSLFFVLITLEDLLTALLPSERRYILEIPFLSMLLSYVAALYFFPAVATVRSELEVCVEQLCQYLPYQ